MEPVLSNPGKLTWYQVTESPILQVDKEGHFQEGPRILDIQGLTKKGIHPNRDSL
jgi:hypothetical protein